MDKLSKENNNLPAKTSGVGTQVTLGVVGNFIYDNYVKGGLPLVISYLTGQLAYVSGFGWFVIVLSAVIVFTLIAISLHLFDLRRARQSVDNPHELSILPEEPVDTGTVKMLRGENKALEDRIANQDSELLGERKQLGKVREQLAGETRIRESRDNEIEGLKYTLRELGEIDRGKDKIIADNQWLIDLAEKQRNNIEDYVKLEKFFWCRIETDTVPLVVFTFQIWNKSLFLATIDNTIDGEIYFRDKPLLDKKRFYEAPLPVSPSDYKWYTFKYYVSGEMARYMTENGEILDNDFQISHLILTIKGAAIGDKIESHSLTIRPNFKVWNYDEYAKSHDKWQQPGN